MCVVNTISTVCVFMSVPSLTPHVSFQRAGIGLSLAQQRVALTQKMNCKKGGKFPTKRQDVDHLVTHNHVKCDVKEPVRIYACPFSNQFTKGITVLKINSSFSCVPSLPNGSWSRLKCHCILERIPSPHHSCGKGLHHQLPFLLFIAL